MNRNDLLPCENSPLIPSVVITASPRSHVSASLLTWLVHLSRFALAALFLFTAGAKLTKANQFASNVSELLDASGFHGWRWAWPAAIFVITAELLTACLLLLPRTVRIGALFAAALLLGFAGYALYYVYILHGEPLECGCFGGIIASQLGVKTALRNLALLVPAALIIVGLRPSQPAGI